MNIFEFEKKVLFDKQCHFILADLEKLLTKWLLGLRANMPKVKKDALISIVKSLTEEHLKKLSDYFGESIQVKLLNSSLIYNEESDIENIKELLEKSEFHNNLCLSRVGNKIFFTFWR